MNMLTSDMGAAIMKNGMAISNMGYVDDKGSLSAETIVRCNEGEVVYAEVVLVNGVTLVPCSFNGMSLVGFQGKLDFKYQ